VLVYLGFNAALSRWPSTRVYAWTFLVPVVAVAVEAIRGALPGIPATIGVIIVIIGVAIVNLPSAEGASTSEVESNDRVGQIAGPRDHVDPSARRNA
jgi:drug/metabolite transporter (DMT)-like permease